MDPLALAYGGNVALGALLVALGLLVVRASPDATTRGPLGLFLVLVGANYALDAVSNGFTGSAADVLRRGAVLASLLDPGVLLVFALAAESGPLGRRRLALAMGSSAILAALYVVASPPIPYMAGWAFRGAHVAQTGILYGLAYYFLFSRFNAEATPALRGRYGLLVVAFGIVVLSRYPLLLPDAGLAHWTPVHLSNTVVTLVLLLAAIASAAAFALSRVPGGRRLARALLLGLAVVAAVWLAALVPGFEKVTFALGYSCRWFLFLPLVVVGAGRFDLFHLPPRARRRIGVALVGATFLVVGLELAAILGTVAGLPVGESLAIAATFSALGALAAIAVRSAVPPDHERAWNARSVYRVHVEAGATAEKLAQLRKRLGLDAHDAAAIEAEAARAEDAMSTGRVREITPGDVLDERFEVKDSLGVGATGVVHEGFDRLRGDRVVLKELLMRWRGDARALEGFRREAEALAVVDHPNVIGFRGIVTIPGGYVLALEKVEGETLDARLARGPLSPSEAARLASDLLSGLAALHAVGLVHRDVKPSNVMLCADGRAVVLDLGASRLERGTIAVGLTHTPGYAAPEQLAGKPVGPPADVYAVGRVLWRAIAGRAAPDGEVPETWRPVLERALSADPVARYEDAAAMLAAIGGRAPSGRASRRAV